MNAGLIRRQFFATLVLCLLAIGLHGVQAAENDDADVRHVLILNSHSVGVPWASMMHDSIRDALSAPGGPEIRLHIEYAGLIEHPGPEYAQALLQFLQLKYQDVPLAAILTLDIAATRWMTDLGVEVFPQVPKIFSVDETDVLRDFMRPQMLGVVAEFDIQRNIDTALALHPGTRHVAIVGGADPLGKAFGKLVTHGIEVHGGALQVIDLIGLPLSEILSRVGQLPAETIVIFLPVIQDGAGEYFVPRRILPRISQASNAPIYGLWDIHVGFGIVGGYVSDTQLIGQALGAAVTEVLAGKPLEEIAIQPRFSSFQYDWAQLQRWNIDPALLPPGSLILNRDLSLWEQYAWQLSATLLLVVTLFLMVFGLVVQRSRLRHVRAALEDARDHLESTVLERTASLNKANEELTASRDRFQRLVEDLGSHAAVYSHNVDGVMDFVGKGVEGILGRRAEECVGLAYPQLVEWDPVGLQRAETALRHMLQTGERVPPWEMAFHRGDGRWGCVLISSHVVRERGADRAHFEGIALDISDLKQAENRAEEAKRLLQAALESSPSGILIADAPGGRVRFANRAALAMRGGEAELIGIDLAQFAESWKVCRPDAKPMTVEDMPLTRSIQRGEIVSAEEAIILAENGGQRWISVSSAPILDDEGRIAAGIVVFSDITQQKNEQQQLQLSAHYDALTGLPNRLLLADRLDQAMARARRDGTRVAVVFIDLDNFKPINDRYGHAVGDRLLIQLSRRMREVLRNADTLARLGGDEFVAVLSGFYEEDDAASLVDRLLEGLAMVAQVDDLCLQVSGSIGVTFYPQEAELNADQLMRQADQAMYQAKVQGRNAWCAFGGGV